MTDDLPRFVHDLLTSPPKRGEGLNLFYFRAARVLHAYRNEDEIIALLEAATAQEPIRRGEIERAVRRSKSCAYQPGQPSITTAPAWPKFNAEKRHAVIKECAAELADLWERSPVRLIDDGCWTEEIIDALFSGNPFLCVGRNRQNFDTRTRDEWRGELAAHQLLVPTPMTKRRGETQEGKQSAHALSITGPRRFLVIEQDRGSIDDQAAVLLHLACRAPLALALYSGKKSVHGWFYCAGQSEERLRAFMRYAIELGADQQLFCPSQFARMPDATRESGQRQTVYFFNPKATR